VEYGFGSILLWKYILGGFAYQKSVNAYSARQVVIPRFLSSNINLQGRTFENRNETTTFGLVNLGSAVTAGSIKPCRLSRW
jgi:hypothetical protein